MADEARVLPGIPIAIENANVAVALWATRTLRTEKRLQQASGTNLISDF